jgi:regulator of replication initiation timing
MMQATTDPRAFSDEKDEIIKRQTLEIAYLSAQVMNAEAMISDAVNARVSEMLTDNKNAIEENLELREILGNVVKTVRVLCKDKAERHKFVHSMQILDEAWYLSIHEDVAREFPQGAFEHYCEFGIFENRKPNRFL